jgi:2-oxoglutarate dehydrogenase E1 component
VAGQGIVYEVIQMMKLEATTPAEPFISSSITKSVSPPVGKMREAAPIAPSVAEVVQAPVFHVNGDDPEAVVFAAELAIEYRQMFNTDVFIDMVCYRKNGHNESDEPRFTQPDLWKIIEKHEDPRRKVQR